MIDDTIAKIEARIRKANSVPEENKAELLNLFSTLKSEVAQLARTDEEQAQSITGFTEVSMHEATQEVEELRPERIVQVPVGVQAPQLVRGRVRAQDDPRRVTGNQVNQQEDKRR